MLYDVDFEACRHGQTPTLNWFTSRTYWRIVRKRKGIVPQNRQLLVEVTIPPGTSRQEDYRPVCAAQQDFSLHFSLPLNFSLTEYSVSLKLSPQTYTPPADLGKANEGKTMAINLDRMLYIVIVDHRSGVYLPERNLCDLDRKTTVQDIATGQIEDVIAVHEYNPAEGTSRDVTEDIMQEAADLILENNRCIDLNDWQRDFVERQERRAAA